MPKSEPFKDLVLSPRAENQDRWRWFYTELRAGILDGRLKPGSRLPSSRSLAAQYGVARGTVVVAFEQLQAEGYLMTEMGAGTRVSLQLPDLPKPPRRANHPQMTLPTVSKRAQQALRGSMKMPLGRSLGRAFRSYEPAIDLFPVETWARVSSRVLRRAPRSLYGQGEAAGYMPLRRAIAEYVGASRGVRCTPHQVIVTAGAQQALDILCRFLLDEGDEAWLEDPGYPGALQALRSAGASVVPVPVDDEGLVVSQGKALAPTARLVYVTPSNQFPLGITMSAARRIELLNWAARRGAWIIEDEYDAEYRYHGRPVASLHSLDRSGCVLYVGTFTKMLFNALRLGFVVVPEQLIEPLELARSFVDRHPPTLDQAVLAEFIADGHFSLHVRKMRQIYAERLQVLRECASQQLGGLMHVQEAVSGMKTIGWLKRHRSDKAVSLRAAKVGLETLPISTFTHSYAQKPALMLGFAGCSEEELRRGIALLSSVLSN